LRATGINNPSPEKVPGRSERCTLQGTIGTMSRLAADVLDGDQIMSVGTILLIILILALIGAFPAWPYSSGWGYYPSGGVGLILIIVLILLLMGRI
jgi:hypothetical protein